MSSSDVEIVRRLFDGFEQADRETIYELLDPEVEWRTSAGDMRGHEGVREWIRELFKTFEAWSSQLVELHDAGDQVVAIVHNRGRSRATGLDLDEIVGHVYAVRDGRIVSMRVYPSAEEAISAAGLEPRTD